MTCITRKIILGCSCVRFGEVTLVHLAPWQQSASEPRSAVDGFQDKKVELQRLTPFPGKAHTRYLHALTCHKDSAMCKSMSYRTKLERMCTHWCKLYMRQVALLANGSI